MYLEDMNNLKRPAAILICSLLVLYLVYYYSRILDLVTKEVTREKESHNFVENFDYLIDTPGCTIPNFARTLRIHEAKNRGSSCGRRAVFVNKIDRQNITFLIDERKFEKTFGTNGYKCCYRYALRSQVTGKEDTDITYTTCKPFKNGTKAILEHEVIEVTCEPNKPKTKKHTAYIDVYLVLKSHNVPKAEAASWNVMILGMDTMSRARAHQSMPKAVKYLQQNDWLDFRVFHKVGFNTFPNIIAVMTGKNLSNVYKACSKGMYYCNDIMMWSKYKRSGYVTAYGEDDLNLPDTFARHKGFTSPPTDHYTRPFFLTGEYTTGNIVCAKHKPSALHLLDYASQFAKEYKLNKFFGMFWINSYSHNINHIPALIEDDIISFLETLKTDGVLDKTFIILFSDHGIRYGSERRTMESYYEERLPMLFMWTPYAFRKLYAKEYQNLQLNQFRLTTHYDLHSTLWSILKRSDDRVMVIQPEACPSCSSLFELKSVHRECNDASISMKWCSCHLLTKVENYQTKTTLVNEIALSHLNNYTKTIETKDCMVCSVFQLKTVLRIHSYGDEYDNKTYYVVAFVVKPGDIAYEMTIEKYNNEYNVLKPTHTISEYSARRNCVKNTNDHEYCVCSKVKNCINTRKT